MILGKFPVSLFPLIGSISALLSIVLCYFIAVRNGHQQPWPHTYISNTARHYPQFIYFRIGTISAAVFIILTYFLNYFWLLSICRESIFHVRKYKPQIFVILGIMGTLYLFGSTATIDTGIMNGKLHIHCAGMFFILTITSCLYNAIICWLVYKQTKKIQKLSMYLKITICVLLIFQLYLQLFKAKGFFKGEQNSDLGHILEYTLAFSVLGYVMLTAYDLKGYSMAYTCVSK